MGLYHLRRSVGCYRWRHGDLQYSVRRVCSKEKKEREIERERKWKRKDSEEYKAKVNPQSNIDTRRQQILQGVLPVALPI